MKRTYYCTKEEPLHNQISPIESLQIEELIVKGYLNVFDYGLLTEMSGEKGCLRYLDLYGVETTDVCTDGEEFYIDKGSLVIASFSFVDSIRLEKIVFPRHLAGIGEGSFINCENLTFDEFPETLVSIGAGAFQNCPKLTDIYFEHMHEGKGFTLGAFASGIEFSGSATNFFSDRAKWPYTEKGDYVYLPDDSGIFTIDGVLFWENGSWFGLKKYPSLNKRTTYMVPKEAACVMTGEGEEMDNMIINSHAFSGCKYLKTLVLQNCQMESYAIYNCPSLETLIFKGCAYGTGFNSMWYYWTKIISDCPKLKDIYIYGERPKCVNFSVLADLENLDDIVLHVPCFCAEKYRNYCIRGDEQYDLIKDLEAAHYPDINEEDNIWRRFKRIEEFDPVDFLEPIE